MPSYRTLCRVWKEWFGSSGARQRYARSAELPLKNGHVVVHRPGQVVALDTTVLPVMLRDGVFGDPVKPHLTIALDTYTIRWSRSGSPWSRALRWTSRCCCGT
ncbi:hypothetical protein [Streptomyces sp. SID161]|uniref:hypothetical protein n=1 Tax=Streptomyces sp. SID161 TaxID=2690251 RepID=UPI001F4292C2|nr:hypothetical protein [Streptomyces sp. SID161]